jgi:oligopeptide/dipeptide ABC transporter ATP-binding protein
MVLQDPMTALDPSFTIGSQVAEPFRWHYGLRHRELDTAVVGALEAVHLSAARERLSQYPYQLSGGMRQRVTSAIAFAGGPSLVIADEPTTALDMTTQARYLSLLKELQETTAVALILIAHDLMVVRHLCQRVIVMYAGQIVEEGPVADVFESPQHPYTRALLNSIPRLDDAIRLESIEGQAPGVGDHLAGCRFAPRCRYAIGQCSEEQPPLTPRGHARQARCWRTGDGDGIEL